MADEQKGTRHRGVRYSAGQVEAIKAGFQTVISRQRNKIHELEETVASKEKTIARLHKLIDRLQPVEVDA